MIKTKEDKSMKKEMMKILLKIKYIFLDFIIKYKLFKQQTIRLVWV
jgi:hypothetical protein